MQRELQCDCVCLGEASFVTDCLCVSPGRANGSSSITSLSELVSDSWLKNDLIPLWIRSVLVFTPVRGMLAAQCSQSLSFSLPCQTLMALYCCVSGSREVMTHWTRQSVELSRCSINNQSVGDSPCENQGPCYHFTTKAFRVSMVIMIIEGLILSFLGV